MDKRMLFGFGMGMRVVVSHHLPKPEASGWILGPAKPARQPRSRRRMKKLYYGTRSRRRGKPLELEQAVMIGGTIYVTPAGYKALNNELNRRAGEAALRKDIRERTARVRAALTTRI